jgi:hypothetical protein
MIYMADSKIDVLSGNRTPISHLLVVYIIHCFISSLIQRTVYSAIFDNIFQIYEVKAAGCIYPPGIQCKTETAQLRRKAHDALPEESYSLQKLLHTLSFDVLFG